MGSNQQKSIVTEAEKNDIHSLDDLGNGRRFADRYGGTVLYCHSDKMWYSWDSTRWYPLQLHEEAELAKTLLDDMQSDISSDTEMKKHIAKSRSRNGIENMLRMAQTDHRIATSYDEFDKDNWILNTKNGTIELKTLNFRPNEPKDKITKVTNVPVFQDAEAPIWENFLHTIWQGNHELIKFIKRLAGYSLTGSIDEQCFMILHGTGKNGKSTFLETIAYIMGDYADTVPFKTLIHSKTGTGADASPDLAKLRGARFVTATEGQESSRFDEALVKALTGGEKINARFLHSNFFSYRPTYKIWLATNHLPRILGTDTGIWRRVIRIPFHYIIPEEQRDHTLSEKLRLEGPGILKWCFEGLIEYLDHGLCIPPIILDATSDYRESMDYLGHFIEDFCEIGNEAKVNNTKLYQTFHTWAKEQGDTPWTQRIFTQKLRERDSRFEQRKSGNERIWYGIGLKIQDNQTIF